MLNLLVLLYLLICLFCGGEIDIAQYERQNRNLLAGCLLWFSILELLVVYIIIQVWTSGLIHGPLSVNFSPRGKIRFFFCLVVTGLPLKLLLLLLT